MKESEKVINKLSEILLYEMGKDELTNSQMAKKCGISKRKLEEIIYRENKGLRIETLVTICRNIDEKFDYNRIFHY